MRQPKLVGLYSFYESDEQYVQGLRDSIPYVDMWISHDDRGSKDFYSHEGEIRNRLIKQAVEAGADWIIGCDPDERYEKRALWIIPELIRKPQLVSYSFRLREMYSPNQYRVDGIWGNKKQTRLFPVTEVNQYVNRPVHSPWNPTNLPVKFIEINLYHFKMLDPRKRVERADIYNIVDKDRLQDYNYLKDETNIKLEKISYGREYRRDAALLQPATLHSRGN